MKQNNDNNNGLTVERPIVRLMVEYKGKVAFINWLIDTGADLTLLSIDTAKQLGMDFTGKTVFIRGIVGGDTFYAKQVNMWADGICPFTATVYISPNNHSNLLGRDVLFKQFAVYMDKDRIVLEQLHHCSMR